MAYHGVDLTHPQWLLARANVVGTRLAPPDQSSPTEWPAEVIFDKPRNEERSFWKGIERKLSLEPFGADIPDVQERSVRPAFLDERVSVDRTIFAHEGKSEVWLAVAFPYATPPIVRRCLYELFGLQNPTTANLRQRKSAVEAPVALAVEAAASRDVASHSPERVLLLTGGAPSLELTAATLTREGETLRVEIRGYAAFDPADAAGSLSRLGGGDPRGRLFHAGVGAEAAKLARASGRAGNPDDVIDLGRHAAAVGAIRYGGVLNQQRWAGSQVRRIDVERSVPVATGVLGTNGGGEWFWRRVLVKNARLGTDPVMAGLTTGASVPDRVALAECPVPGFASRRWLARKDWAAAGLRWHDVVENSQKLDAWDLQLRMIPASQQRHRLSYPLWEIVPGRDDPHPAGTAVASR